MGNTKCFRVQLVNDQRYFFFLCTNKSIVSEFCSTKYSDETNKYLPAEHFDPREGVHVSIDIFTKE